MHIVRAVAQRGIFVLPGGIEKRWVQDEDDHLLEAMLGFPLFTDGEERLGWLMNLNAVRTCSLVPLPEPNRLGVCF